MHPPDLRIKSENFHQRPQRIMWHIVATRPLTCLSTIWSNSKGAFWTCCVIPNRWICPRKRQKLYNKRLYVTSSMENWGTIPFVITVTWRENFVVQLIVPLTWIIGYMSEFPYSFRTSKATTLTTLWMPSASLNIKRLTASPKTTRSIFRFRWAD